MTWCQNSCTATDRSCLCSKAFELQGVVSRDMVLRLLRARIGLMPIPQPGQVGRPPCAGYH